MRQSIGVQKTAHLTHISNERNDKGGVFCYIFYNSEDPRQHRFLPNKIFIVSIYAVAIHQEKSSIKTKSPVGKRRLNFFFLNRGKVNECNIAKKNQD